MPLADYLSGLFALTLLVAPLAFGALRVRRRWFRDWSGADARLVEAVLFLTALVMTAQVLGVLGVLSRTLLVVGVLLVATAMTVIGSKAAAADEAQGGPETAAVVFAGAAAAAAVVGNWVTRIVAVLHGGMIREDSLSYHMPWAARFVQTGDIKPVHYFVPGLSTNFDPGNGQLVHAIVMLPFQSDFLSPFVNLAWLGLALLAAWCIGHAFRGGGLAIAGTALVVGTPLMAGTQAGEGLNDLASIALFLAVMALLLRAEWRSPGVVVASAAAGLAMGVKLNVAVPLAVLTTGLLWACPNGERGRVAVRWLVPAVLTGGVWYVRNALSVGSPLPQLDLPLLAEPRFPLNELTGYSVAHYATDFDLWRSVFWPGIRQAFGPAWWAVLLLPLLAPVVVAVTSRERLLRVFAVVGLASYVGYFVTPGTAFGLEGQPLFFRENLRILAPALLIGMVLMPAAIAALGRSAAWCTRVAVVVALLVIITQVGLPLGSGWPAAFRIHGFVAAATLLVVTIAWLRLKSGTSRWLAPAALVLACVAAVAGWPVQRTYFAERFAAANRPRQELYRWARRIHDARIAVAGFYQVYPLYGARLENRVQRVGVENPDGSFQDVPSCRRWQDELERGRYNLVAVSPLDFERREPIEAAWTLAATTSETLFRAGLASVIRAGDPDPAQCVRDGGFPLTRPP